MDAKEILKLISMQRCNLDDLIKLTEIGKNNAVKLRRGIKNDLINKAYTLPNNRLPMIEVINKFKIHINYLEKMAKEKLNMIRENGLYCLLGEAKVGKSALTLQIANIVYNGISFKI